MLKKKYRKLMRITNTVVQLKLTGVRDQIPWLIIPTPFIVQPTYHF